MNIEVNEQTGADALPEFIEFNDEDPRVGPFAQRHQKP